VAMKNVVLHDKETIETQTTIHYLMTSTLRRYS